MSDQYPPPETDGPAGQEGLPPGPPPQLPPAPQVPPVPPAPEAPQYAVPPVPSYPAGPGPAGPSPADQRVPGQPYVIQPPWGQAPRPPTRRRRGLIVGIVAAVLVVLAGTTATVLVLNHRADVAAEVRKAEAALKAEEKRQAEEERKAEEEAASLAEARATYTACTDQLDQLMTALSNIDARLDVGLSQGELADVLGKASIAYNRINIDNLGDGNCLSAGAKLETAFNKYNATVGPWEDCIYDYYCDVDADVLPGMQQKWAKASGLIDQAGALLTTLDPDSATYDEAATGDPV